MERCLFAIAGTFVLISVSLGYWVNPMWFFLTAFVGVNLIQSAFTRWCPMMSILRMLRIRTCSDAADVRNSGLSVK
jgi:Inner membrane protein YgaP-like, transmembrane domain